MKNWLGNLFTGMLGAVLVMSGYLWIQKGNSGFSKMNAPAPAAVSVGLNSSMGPDFSFAAEKGLNVVVQINAQESEKQKKKKMEDQNPYFNNPFFR